jgi:hypothetical protein
MGILTSEQVRRIAEAVRGTNKELRGLSERLLVLGEENPQVSSAVLEQAAESAVQALIIGAKSANYQPSGTSAFSLLPTPPPPRLGRGLGGHIPGI